MTTIHFVCRGNALRSLTAEAYLRSLEIDNIAVLSSGTVAEEFRTRNESTFARTLKRLQEHQIASKYFKGRADQLTKQRVTPDQLLIFVNQIVRKEATSLIDIPENSIVWDIVDVGEGARLPQSLDETAVYENEIYQEVVTRVDDLVTTLFPVRS